MALNFPDPADATVYTDSASGLKYVWNSAVLAWESAIQPPVIIKSTTPNITIDGFTWFNPENGALSLRNVASGGGGWTELLRVGDTEATPVTITIQETPPNPANSSANNIGDLWWDNSGVDATVSGGGGGGRLYVWYQDVDSAQWMDASPMGQGQVLATAFYSNSQPSGDTSGMLWFDTSDQQADDGTPIRGQLKVRAGDEFVVAVTSTTGVDNVVGTAPVVVSSPGNDGTGVVTISCNEATTTTSGIIQVAAQEATNTATGGNVALTPKKLSNALMNASYITNYIPQAASGATGVTRYATEVEAAAANLDTCAITPFTMGTAIASLANPPGSVLMFAGGAAVIPAGYILCDGTSYSQGDAKWTQKLQDVLNPGQTTFIVPNLMDDTFEPICPRITAGTSLGADPSGTAFETFDGITSYIIKN